MVTDAAVRAVENGVTQYARSWGHPRLVNALAQYLSPSFKRDISPMTEIVTTVGATEALLLSTLALLDPDDEAMLIAPFYDSYPEQVHLAGGRCIYVTMRESTTRRSDGSYGNASDWKVKCFFFKNNNNNIYF